MLATGPDDQTILSLGLVSSLIKLRPRTPSGAVSLHGPRAAPRPAPEPADRRAARHPEDAGGFFFQAEDGIRDGTVTGVQTCALPICGAATEARQLARPAGQHRRLPWQGGARDLHLRPLPRHLPADREQSSRGPEATRQ